MADADPPRRGFDVLSDETRLGIVRALADRLRETPEDPTVGFAHLRRQVGVSDSGNFNYHLERLDGRFVRKTADGYRIAPAGIMVVAALITGVYGESSQLGPTELDDTCPACGEVFTATYEESVLRVTCPNEYTFQHALPPGVVDDRELADLIELLTLKTRHDLQLALEGVCPFCYAQLAWSFDAEVRAEMPKVDTRCSRCGVHFTVPIIMSVVHHPIVASFYHDHGIDVRKRPLWAPEFFDGVDVTVPDSDQVRVTIERGDGTVTVTLDQSLSVVEVVRK